MTHTIRITVAGGWVAIGLLAAVPAADQETPADPRAKEFQSLCAGIAKDAGATTDAQIIRALDLGDALGRPYGASLTVRKYLAAKPNPSAAVLRKAIDNAVRTGDFRTTAARCKAYLQSARPGGDASKVAAILYGVQLDYLDARDDTYQFMTSVGGEFRQSPRARKFDRWYVNEAMRRRDVAAVARRLTFVFGDKLPLEQEREYYWEALDWLIKEIRSPVPAKFAAASDCRKLAGMIRGDEKRKAAMSFYAEYLAFKAGAAGKDAAVLEREFKAVVAAADAYLARYLNAETLKDILYVFADGEPDHGWRKNQVEAKQKFFLSAFDKIPDEDREEIMAWDYRGYIATPAGWSELGSRHAALFRRSAATAGLSFVTSAATNTPALFQKQAAFLRGVPSRDAAIINSLAAGTDFNRCVDHLMREEAWHLDDGIRNTYGIVGHLWSVFSSYPRGEQDTLPADMHDKAMHRFGTQFVARTPLAFNHELVSEMLLSSWRCVDDKSRLAPILAAYDWVPYSPGQRKAVFSRVYGEFKRWAMDTRKNAGTTQAEAKSLAERLEREKTQLAETTKELAESSTESEWKIQRLKTSQERHEANIKEFTTELARTEAKVKEQQAGLAAITGLEDAFKKAQDSRGDPEKAPDDYCRQWARMLAAEENGDAQAFMAAARGLYAQVKLPRQSKLPFAREALFGMVRPRAGNKKNKNLDVFDLQCEILADQLTRWDPEGPNTRVRGMADAVMRSHRGWGWGYIPKTDKDRSLRLNGIFAKALESQLGRGDWKQLLDWMLMTRRGRDWRESDANNDLFEKIIKGRRLPVSTLMSYVRSRDYFQGLAGKYPVETYFDDAWVQEAKETGRLDIAYFYQGGQDKQGKVRAYAANAFGNMAVIPRGYGDDKVTYSRSELSAWHEQLMRAQPAVRNVFLDKVAEHYGKGRFDEVAMGRLDLSYRADGHTAEGRNAFFAGLSRYLDRVEKTPARPALPNMAALSQIPPGQPLENAQIDVLLRMFSGGCRPARWNIGYAEQMVNRLQDALLARGRDRDLFALIPDLWRTALDVGSEGMRQSLARFSEKLANDGKYELAALYSASGLDLLGTALDDETRNLLNVVRARAIKELGYAIPVERSDPRYAIFSAQEDYLAGSVQRAWQSYLSKAEVFADAIPELDPTFVTWVINMHSQAGEFKEAESYARTLMTLMDKEGSGYSAETRALVVLTYADIAFHRLEYPRAKALYGRIAAAKEFDGTRAQVDARFRMVDVDRITGQFDEAMQRLDEIAKDKSRYVQQEVFYHTARIKFDTGEPLEALDYLNRVFALNPNHATGRILEGRVNLALKDYEKARELRHVGESMDLNIIVPGKPLRISLSDENLSVVGESTRIGTRIWTDSGDEEILVLTPFADSKTLFEGELKTLLAPTVKGDKVLQVLGNDRVHYDFSDAFKAMQGITESVTHTLSVVSDPALYTSSGKILTDEEYEIRSLEEQILARRKDSAEAVALSTVRASNQIKPGNRINVRVVDADRSISAQKDRVVVSVTTTSGDSIPAFPLVETETHSGVFEGAVPTESAPATAFASDSQEGREPNFVISSGEYPPWIGLPDNVRPKTFSVDLNEYAALGNMKLEAREPGRKLKDFILQTSPNGKDFETIASWPTPAEPWDGSPLAVLMRKPLVKGQQPKRKNDAQEPELLDGTAIDRALDDASWSRKRAVRTKTVSAAWKEDLLGQADALGIGADDRYIMRLSAAFYHPRRQVRTFQLKCRSGEAAYLLLIDGQMGKRLDEEGREVAAPHDYTGALKKGVHRVDVYVEAVRKHSPGFELLHDVDAQGTLGACPPDLFDPAAHPEIADAVYRAPAGIVPNEDATSFAISFGQNTRARVLRFILHDFETDAPAIHALTLKAPDGRTLLPTLSDLMALRENERLEIVPGDRISVSYEDPTCVDKAKRVQESFLSATYANATVNAVFVQGDEKGARYIPLRRFTPGDAVAVLINDPDLDGSDKLDTAAFTVRSALTSPRKLAALETGEHTGTFVGRFFPVAGPPQRASEITVGQEDEAVITYHDAENTDPGIGWDRQTEIEQAYYVKPELRVYNALSSPMTEEELAKLVPGSLAMRTLSAVRPEKQDSNDVARAVPGGSVVVEVLWPTIAKSPQSAATLYVQTASGRDARGADLRQPFDVDVWDTMALERTVSDTAPLTVPVGYAPGKVVGDRYAETALDDGRFTFSIPTTLGEQEDDKALRVKNTDTVFVGFRYVDDKGQTNWLTRQVSLFADAFFSVMDREYTKPATGRYVGESVYLRVINMMKDASDKRDSVQVTLAGAGIERRMTLTETLTHSGVFQGMCKFTFATGATNAPEPNTMPVKYGSTVVASYDPDNGSAPITHSVEIYKGSDGTVLPFTKRFKDPEMAVRTRLTLAEAYFELAKKHRGLKQQEIAEKEIAEGKRLLEEALKEFPGTELRAQADYLLANLVLELAEETQNAKEKVKYFSSAVVQFSDIVANYRSSGYAPKAQFKKALALELMGDIDRASDEYVKLAYRWPDNELVPETVARLGEYFFTKGMALVTQAEKEADDVQKEVLLLQSREPFTTAAEVYSSLGERFPNHKLADKTTAVAGQCFMRARNYEKAAKTFERLLEKRDVDKELMAEALYWCGDCYTKEENLDLKEAYKRFKRLDWDYPASKWAKFARGRLLGEDLAKYDVIQQDK